MARRWTQRNDLGITTEVGVGLLLTLILLLLMPLLVPTRRGVDWNPGPQANDPRANPESSAAASPTPDQLTRDNEKAFKQTRDLYVAQCAGCHGANGDGRGPAATVLFPRPRDFRAGRFRLVTTSNGVPTIEDLVEVLRRGIPGSSMPPWPAIDKPRWKMLANFVVELRRQGIRETEQAQARELGEEPVEEETVELVHQLTTPGPLIDVPQLEPSGAESIDRGESLYLKQGCGGCHGKQGRGDGQEKMVNAEGLPNPPRDLTRGIFKGNFDPESIYRRILAGMPGSAMPSAKKLLPGQVADLVNFVLALSDQATRDATVLNRERILARKVTDWPENPADSFWERNPATRVRLMPLWWRDEFPTDVLVRAVHDGQSLALQVSWEDSRPDNSLVRTESFRDAVAVQFYQGDLEPFLGMGARNDVLDVWMWDGGRQHGAPSLEEVYPRIVVDWYPFSETAVTSPEYRRSGTRTSAQSKLTLAAKAAGNSIVPEANGPVAASLQSRSPGTLAFRPRPSQLVSTRGNWQGGRWRVVFHRPLVVGAGDGVSLVPGRSASIALAIWDGSRRDRNGKKLITIWQDLELEEN
ncbi:MAG: hypothetical protein CMJ65_11310 [Planctomycetaceae bacterium]|jgi:mono/diheme cytochrome c family protein|nr:hypothetical protein [Planctomycetaceae bacterium]